ncbi:hypothetical protein BUALT_Bualt17G0056700 [Buddleja alternifolia]|uniref:Uncharacterized protein n=1 Tax=Buddleja alternifolia TaxID=168488 RepID=A0AAV6WH58_9LAMI|nr:hypothetical protein BUALT_Bualt17G0056700 [Buddleja alternifolia]
MINAFPGSMETENLEGSGRRIVNMAESETQQIALLANALWLADELLPRATLKLSSTNRSDDPSRRGAVCEVNTGSQHCIGYVVGRERFATILLMRLTETVILWLSDDQSFWDEIEAGPKPLGPLGLQQFYLDMEFVILFSSQGRYLSRNLHQVMKNIIGRAIEAVQANKIDPYSVLPDDEWFADVAQIAIKMLTGKANFENGERDMSSPTASVSARSASSVHSHGSN